MSLKNWKNEGENGTLFHTCIQKCKIFVQNNIINNIEFVQLIITTHCVVDNMF